MGLLGLDVLDLREGRFALDDAERAVPALLLDQVVQVARLVNVGRDVDRPGRRHLATPFIAVALFFITGFNGSFAWSWLWFLLIPVAGIVLYSGDNPKKRRKQGDG